MSVTPANKRLTPGFVLRFSLSLTQRMAAPNRYPDRGLTLIEGLVAIVIVSVTLVSITPPIFWATGTRVQNRRAEQALQLAQGEIDRVRTIVDQGKATIELLPAAIATAGPLRSASVAAPNIPGNIATVNPKCTSVDDGIPAVNKYTQVNTDPNPENPNDCKANFLIQTFRSTGFATVAGGVPDGFVMGVRVYSIVAEPNLKAGKGLTEQASLKGTNGLGNQLTRPLAVQYSTIVRSNASQNLEIYRRLCPNPGAGEC
ncbi:MAG: type II secretion system GspH family protein [Phormidesmis sp. CAN_BIN44]|nr:type II secretion system GspH family protein [Phormidesmis sp. CAN_BIN44]